MLSDLPTNLSPGWQAVDMAIRCLRTALRAEDMQKAPKVVAALQSVQNVCNKLLSAYTSGTTSGNATPEASTQGPAPDSAPSSPDADAQPDSSVSSLDANASE